MYYTNRDVSEDRSMYTNLWSIWVGVCIVNVNKQVLYRGDHTKV